MFTLPT